MRIAVIGAGVSGLLAARLLSTRHEVQLLEASDFLGGHANTVYVSIDRRTFAVDTGFMVFNERTYPNFLRLLDLLGIFSQPSDMSFSVTCERTGWEYQGSSLSGMFAQTRNICRPAFLRMIVDILRFNRDAKEFLAKADFSITLDQFLRDAQYSEAFCEKYLLPMTAAIWSSPTESIRDFPAHFLLRFMQNHGLLQIRDRPRWQTIPGGSRRYIRALATGLEDRIRLGCSVRAVTRGLDQIVVETDTNKKQVFDAVVMATHADTTLNLLADADDRERIILSAILYQQNSAVLHTDVSWLPSRKTAWASWNYRISDSETQRTCVTYDLTRLQRIDSPQRILLTLNPHRRIPKSKFLREFAYSHPIFNAEGIAAQYRLPEISGTKRTYFCGAYWGNGFHEDGVVSALAVADQFGIGLEACTAACTKDLLRTFEPVR
ncbi:NAD(P)/FAD-dependent oxidoreductase [Bythopirellula polymerisocia]|uniref:Protoporphyrinogen oxidase n=1 Tax=Bythopirellula polymerisocia TaxID=2528003 RepID=A0A5C6CXV9_9BACT|nr:FAD-dependent oxidoreductase [Bythopirellula polymerisocia]TWU27479.1 protoporphyrinogen oxidase [Bythopirellula polymerisocia]